MLRLCLNSKRGFTYFVTFPSGSNYQMANGQQKKLFVLSVPAVYEEIGPFIVQETGIWLNFGQNCVKSMTKNKRLLLLQ